MTTDDVLRAELANQGTILRNLSQRVLFSISRPSDHPEDIVAMAKALQENAGAIRDIAARLSARKTP